MAGPQLRFRGKHKVPVFTFEKLNKVCTIRWRRITVPVLGLILSLGMSSRAADRPPLVGIAHIAFQVSDLAKAQAFYGGLLGYEDAFRLYKEDGTTRLVYFKVNDRQYIEVLPDLPPEQDDRLSHIALETTNLEALRLYLAEKAIQVPEKVNQGQDGNLNFTVKDPDGHRVEFVQYQPGSMQMKAKGSYLGPKRVSSRMLHVGVTVADAAAADRFYKDILGFSEIWRGGATDDVTSWINMKVPDGTDYVEYMLVTGEAGRKQLGTLHHAALLVPDIQQALEALRERPLGWDPAHVQAPRVGRNKRWQLNLYDPDGSRMELMEPFTMR
jgi:catechol 2,3-dioxygenase-like lactoylglutathione lyase family enzyme